MNVRLKAINYRLVSVYAALISIVKALKQAARQEFPFRLNEISKIKARHCLSEQVAKPIWELFQVKSKPV